MEVTVFWDVIPCRLFDRYQYVSGCVKHNLYSAIYPVSRDSSDGIATGYGLDVVQTGSGAHPASYPMGKAAGA
jgi:hypothetical protein